MLDTSKQESNNRHKQILYSENERERNKPRILLKNDFDTYDMSLSLIFLVKVTINYREAK